MYYIYLQLYKYVKIFNRFLFNLYEEFMDLLIQSQYNEVLQKTNEDKNIRFL